MNIEELKAKLEGNDIIVYPQRWYEAGREKGVKTIPMGTLAYYNFIYERVLHYRIDVPITEEHQYYHGCPEQLSLDKIWKITVISPDGEFIETIKLNRKYSNSDRE